jgi:hypothetical protein
MIEIKPGEFVMYQGNPPAVIQKGEMSLRDYFAAAIAQGVCSRPLIDLATESNSVDKDVKTYVAESSYSLADALLKARVKDLDACG